MTDRTHAIDPQTLLAHGDFVRGIARSLLFDEHAADDVVQETWLAALESLGARPESPRGWLGAVARNIAVKRLRGERRRAVREAAVARREDVPSNEDVLDRERLRRSVVDAVLALPEPYRATVLLRYFEGLPPREAAARMDVPVETVRTRTRRAIELLRRRLDAQHADDRRSFCAALAAWSDGAHGAPGVGAGTGGLVMGTKTVMAVGVVALAIAGWFLWPRDAASPPKDTAASTAATQKTSPPPRAEPEPPRVETPLPPPAPVKPIVRGRVADREGHAAPGMTLFVTSESGNAVQATTDADGRFDATLKSAGKCSVILMPAPAFEPPRERREAIAPADGVDLVVDRKPVATLVVTAFDAEESRAIAQFGASFGGKDLRTAPQTATDGRIEAVVRLAAAAGDTVKVAVSAGGATGERDVAVREGERVEVRIDLRRGGAVTGRVTDASSRPLANALVFFGEEDVARGDEPFKPFDEKRVREGVRTDADGRFELRGAGRWVTVWHADASPATVARGAAANVALGARGAIRGVVRGDDGAPVAGRKVFLDRIAQATTDAEGRFAFDKVEAGWRGIGLDAAKAKSYTAVRVAAGETAEVEVKPGIAKVRIEWPGRANFGRAVVLVPLSASGSLTAAMPEDGALVTAGVAPGRYVLICEGGGAAVADIAGPDARVLAGTGEIVVRAKPKTRAWVLPADSGYLARLMAGRQAGKGVPDDGIQRFSGLAPGRYDVGVERDGVRVTVEVKDGAVDVAID